MSDQSSPTIFSDEDFSDEEYPIENSPNIEFRSPEDEAWYEVEVWDMCDALVVSFNGFSCGYDEVYTPEDFKNDEEIKEFEERFRASFEQMQDIQCPTVVKGTRVCATRPSISDEVKFHDAIVDQVERTKHGRDEEGSEVCGCNFKLSWIQGPYVGQITSRKVGDICLRPDDNRMNPKVVSFLKEVKRQIHGEAHQGEETEWQKIIKKVTSAMESHYLSSYVSENLG